MTKIYNRDSRKSADAEIITGHNNELNWAIAAFPYASRYGWQIVRENHGKYTYNETMMGGYEDSLDAVRDMARKAGYEVIA